MKNKISVWLMWGVIFTPSFSLFAMVFHEPVIESRPLVEPSEGGRSTDNFPEQHERELQKVALQREQLLGRPLAGGPKKGQKQLEKLNPVIEVPEPGDEPVVAGGDHQTGGDTELTVAEKRAIQSAGTEKSFSSAPVRIETLDEVIAQHKKALDQLKAQLKELQAKELEVGVNHSQVISKIQALQDRIQELTDKVIKNPELLPSAPKPIEVPKKKSGFFKKKKEKYF